MSRKKHLSIPHTKEVKVKWGLTAKEYCKLYRKIEKEMGYE